ncbi:hypothetical protein HDU76_005914 [Blyttiomyces sp. JEL0837]|nr:hypothetical protein HDU76_005914 [Blyttiomyces sp. JEL0837]
MLGGGSSSALRSLSPAVTAGDPTQTGNEGVIIKSTNVNEKGKKDNSNNDNDHLSPLVAFVSSNHTIRLDRKSINSSLVKLKRKIAKDMELVESTVTISYMDSRNGTRITVTGDGSLADSLSKTRVFLVYGTPTSVLQSQQQEQSLCLPKLKSFWGRSKSQNAPRNSNIANLGGVGTKTGTSPFVVKVTYDGTAYAIEVSEVSLGALGEQFRKQFGWTKEDVEAIYITHESVVVTSSRYLQYALESWNREKKAMEFVVKRKQMPTRPLLLEHKVKKTLVSDVVTNSLVSAGNSSKLDSRDGEETFEDSSDVMISYEWSSGKTLAKKIKQELELRGLRVWFDETEMHSHMYERMAEGVIQSQVITPILTAKYSKSPNCKRELSYAADLRKHIEPTRALRDGEKLDPWVTLVTAGIIYYSFDDNVNDPTKFEESMTALYSGIRKYLDAVAETKRREMAREKSKGGGVDSLQAQLAQIRGPDNPYSQQVYAVLAPVQHQFNPTSLSPFEQKVGYLEMGGGVQERKEKVLDGVPNAPTGYIGGIPPAAFEYPHTEKDGDGVSGRDQGDVKWLYKLLDIQGRHQYQMPMSSYPFVLKATESPQAFPQPPPSTTRSSSASMNTFAVSSTSSGYTLVNTSTPTTLPSYIPITPPRGMPSTANSSASTTVDSSSLELLRRYYMPPPPPTPEFANFSASKVVNSSHSSSSAGTVVVSSSQAVATPAHMPKSEDRSSSGALRAVDVPKSISGQSGELRESGELAGDIKGKTKAMSGNTFKSNPKVDGYSYDLEPVNFDTDIRRTKQDYVSSTRFWAMDVIRDWLHQSYYDKAVIRISFFGLKVVQHDWGSQNTSKRIMTTIASDLAKVNPRFKRFLEQETSIPPTSSRGTVNNNNDILSIVIKALNFILKPEEHILIIIDGLNEIRKQGDGVRKSVTPEFDIFKALHQFDSLVLNPEDVNNLDDAKTFIKFQLSKRLIVEEERDGDGNNQSRVNEIVDVLDVKLFIEDRIPAGLDNLFSNILEKGFVDADEGVLFRYKKVMGVIVCYGDPLDQGGIAKLAELTIGETGGIVIRRWTVHVVHKSLKDFLTSTVRCTNPAFHIDVSMFEALLQE